MLENLSQDKAIDTINGPLIVVSCPGSGKTTTMLRRIRNMIEKGVDPRRIIMVTFTVNAADEMKTKYQRMYGEPPAGVTFATLHAMCLGIMKRAGLETKLFSEEDKREFMMGAMGYYGSYIDDRFDMAVQLLQEFSAMRNREISPKDYEPKCCEKEFYLEMYNRYDEEKKAGGRIDFDDMIVIVRDYLRQNPDFLRECQQQYDYIQCDEYQDTNSIQRDILYMLAGDKANLCVVGDDDQAIYRFRGTDSSIMMNFSSDFESRGKKCEVVKMEVNYRCKQKIVDMASACISFNRKKNKKNFISEKGKADSIEGRGRAEYIKTKSAAEETKRAVEIIKARHESGVPYSRMAVLYRKNRQATLPAQYLSAEGIPYCTNDRLVCVYDEWMFRDIRAYAEMSMGICVDENKMRVLNRPSRYFSPQVFRRLPFTAEGMLSGIEVKKDGEEWKNRAAEKNVFEWLNNFGPGKVSPDDPPSKLFRGLTGTGSVHYDKYIRDRAKFKNEDLAELMSQFGDLKNEAGRFSTISEWFAHADRIRRMVASDRKKNDRNGVRLSTIHGAKGLEWDTVIVIGVNQNNIPGKRAETDDDIEEERRILYVAMTRAENELYITGYGQESRFMIQTNEALKELYSPVVPKKLRGTRVVNTKYGEGKIQGYTKDRVLVEYREHGIKKYRFPDAFIKGYLRYV